MLYTTKNPTSRAHTRVVLVVVLLIACGHVTGAQEPAYLATTIYSNAYCAGTPPMIEYSVGNDGDSHCAQGVDGNSWTEDLWVVDLYAHSMKQFGGTSFILRSKVDACSVNVLSAVFHEAVAYAASGQCYKYHSKNGWVSLSAAIRNNTATFRQFTDDICQKEDTKNSLELMAHASKTGAGYCKAGWLWQVFDSTGQNWNESAPEPTQAAPPTTSPVVTTNKPLADRDATSSFPPVATSLKNPTHTSSSSILMAMDGVGLWVLCVMMFGRSIGQTLRQ